MNDVIEQTKKLINLGYSHSADSFSAIAKQKIEIETSDMIIEDLDDFHLEKLRGKHYKILITDIIGQLPGKSYLVFNEVETKELYDTCLPPKKEGSDRSEMENAILLEIDNMLAAAVITKFSNHLNAKIFGGVPSLYSSDVNNLENFIKDDLKKANFNTEGATVFISTNTKFKFEHNDEMTPEFIWIMPKEFLEEVEVKMQEGVLL